MGWGLGSRPGFEATLPGRGGWGGPGAGRGSPARSLTDLRGDGEVQLLHGVLAPVGEQRARHGDVADPPGLEVHVVPVEGELVREVAVAVQAAAGQRRQESQAQHKGHGPPAAGRPTNQRRFVRRAPANCGPRHAAPRPRPEATPRNGPRRRRPQDSPRPVAHASAAPPSPLPGLSRLPRSGVASQVARQLRGACACAPRLLPGWPPTSAAEVGAGGRGRGGAHLGRVPPPGATRRDPGGLLWKARARRLIGGRLAGERVLGGAAAPRGPGLGTPGCGTRTAVGHQSGPGGGTRAAGRRVPRGSWAERAWGSGENSGGGQQSPRMVKLQQTEHATLGPPAVVLVPKAHLGPPNPHPRSDP